MTTNPNDIPTVDQILESVYDEGYAECYNGGGSLEHISVEATAQIESLIKWVIGDAVTCKPDCTDVEHAYHRGQYELIEAQLTRLNQAVRNEK